MHSYDNYALTMTNKSYKIGCSKINNQYLRPIIEKYWSIITFRCLVKQYLCPGSQAVWRQLNVISSMPRSPPVNCRDHWDPSHNAMTDIGPDNAMDNMGLQKQCCIPKYIAITKCNN